MILFMMFPQAVHFFGLVCSEGNSNEPFSTTPKLFLSVLMVLCGAVNINEQESHKTPL